VKSYFTTPLNSVYIYSLSCCSRMPRTHLNIRVCPSICVVNLLIIQIPCVSLEDLDMDKTAQWIIFMMLITILWIF